jgi:hypothetical protein
MNYDTTKAIGKANLLGLPREVIELIGFYCAMSTPGPSLLSMAVDTNTDHAVEGRPPAYATPPVNLRSLAVTCHRMYAALNAEVNTGLYARVFRTKFDVDVIERRFGKQAIDSRNLTEQLKWRCTRLKNIRRLVDESVGQNDPIRCFDDPSDSDQEEVQQDLWLAYMMVTENEGLNIKQLRWAALRSYLDLYLQAVFRQARRKGYPDQSCSTALALQLDYLLTNISELRSQSSDASMRKLFILRPFVFAAHRYDAFLAPWTLRAIPLQPSDVNEIHHDHATSDAARNPFIANLNVSEESSLLRYCGQTLRIRAPNLAQAACCSFFIKIENDPSVSSIIPGLNENMGAGQANGMYQGDAEDDEEDEAASARERHPGGRPVLLREPLSLQSTDHDIDISRLLACASPHHSAGFRVTDHIGKLQGSWEGRFAFFDFDSYRDMLGGKIRALYEGPFGEQAQVWKLREHVVKVEQGQYAGGKGSMLNAGFLDSDPEPDRMVSLSVDEVTRMCESAKKGDEATGTMTRLSGVDKDATEPDRYEILVSGEGHSAWGRFILRGRIRTWDGLVTLAKEYRPTARGRWLYRGYIIAGGKLVGRWRDTFTPESMSGYEGSMLMQRRGDY